MAEGALTMKGRWRQQSWVLGFGLPQLVAVTTQ
jgi:hypothetical protein